MGAYRDDRSWSDLMADEIREIVGPFLLKPTPFEMDAKEAADFFVFTAKDMTIAARVRRPGFERYRFEFTIRSSRDNGTETELSKIINGFGDWFFYGHADKENRINLWWLLDLNAFRAGLIRSVLTGHKLKVEDRSNHDGTHFKAFDVRSFANKPSLVIGCCASLACELNENLIGAPA